MSKRERRKEKGERGGGGRTRERGRGLKIDWPSPRAHSSRFHGQALSIGGRRGGRAKERKERSFGVHREGVEPGPFGSRGAHNAAIVSRALPPSGPPPSSWAALRALQRARSLSRALFLSRAAQFRRASLLRTAAGQLAFLFRDMRDRYVRLNERSFLVPSSLSLSRSLVRSFSTSLSSS